jgi:Na+/melibiose symporter-like transporter
LFLTFGRFDALGKDRVKRNASRVTPQAAFRWLWAGQATSAFGTAAGTFALPTLAVIAFHASPPVMGVLVAVQFSAYPVVSLAAGVLADRWSRRATMLAADAVRALAVGSIPLGAALHRLDILWLLLVSAVLGAASAFFDVAYQSFVPVIAPRAELERANARLEFTNSAAQIGGKGLGGVLIAAIGAADVMLLDAATFVVSALSVAVIRAREPHRETAAREPFVRAVRAGFAVVFRTPPLRMIVASTTMSNLASALVGSLYFIFAYRILHVPPQVLGVMLAVANLGFLGALAAPRVVRALGVRATLVASMAGCAASYAILPLATAGAPVAVLLLSQLGLTMSVTVYNVVQISARTRLVAPEMLGRMTATMRTIGMGVMPLGALLGGVCGERFGVVNALIASACVAFLAVPLLLAPGGAAFAGAAPAPMNAAEARSR